MSVIVALLIKDGNASGSRTFVTICNGLAPKALAVSINPLGTSNKLFSTNRAMNGAAPILNGTSAAYTPIEVPTNALVNGISQTIKMINGMERNTFTNTDKTRLYKRFSSSCPFLVRNKTIPKGSPITKPKNPDVNVIKTVSQIPFKSNEIVVW